MKQVRVELGERSYNIYISADSLPKIGEVIKEHGLKGKICIITNPTVSKLYKETIVESLEKEALESYVIEIPDGESYKNLKYAEKLYDKLIEYKFDRKSVILALGGGVIGDLAGFVAATYMRGIAYIQVPTTLLAQVDSSVGGKVAVNHPQGKNMIGAFYQPKFVFTDISTIKTLPKRELISGLAEVIKYGVIADADFFTYLEENMPKILNLDCNYLSYLIEISCGIKAQVVAQDEQEFGLRAILNYGHTIGHALETVTNYQRFKHGEAVGLGMIYAAKISHYLNLCDKEVVDRHYSLIKAAGLSDDINDSSTKQPLIVNNEKRRTKNKKRVFIDEVISTLYLDKKVHYGKLRFILTERIGSVIIANNVTNCIIRKALEN
ncbi:MAG: 3-dehydroquinate synthase [bacterium]